MPTWGELAKEISKASATNGQSPHDVVRRKYLRLLYQHTKRAVILYASAFTQKPGIVSQDIMINDEDLQGMMEVIHGIGCDEVDLIIHSPGGSPEAADAILRYLRSRFCHIRAFVPSLAMSAATMLACGADVISMGKHSFLGPVDPQMVFPSSVGVVQAPAQAIIDQFRMAQLECKDPDKLGSWIPILEQYGPALLTQCSNAQKLSEELVRSWLRTYMFAARSDRETRAEEAAAKLADHTRYKSHSRHISREDVRADIGLEVESLEDDQRLQDLVLSIFHATTHTFSSTGAVKIIENHHGAAFIKSVQVVAVQGQPPARK
jgi:ATP-dependent protease ClpP protease subunit